MDTILKNRKKIILSSITVIIALVIIALAIIIGTAPFEAHGAMRGESALTSTAYKNLKNAINAAKNSDELKATITQGSQVLALASNENKYIRKLLGEKAAALGLSSSDTGLTAPRKLLDDYYQWKYTQNTKEDYNGNFLRGVYDSAAINGSNDNTINRSAGQNGFIKGIGDGGCTISGITLKLYLNSPFLTFHGPMVIKDGGKVEIYIGSDYSGSGSKIKREMEETLRDTTTDIIACDATDGVVTQFSGALFRVYDGSLTIKGASGNNISISGGGNFDFDNTESTAQDGGLVFPSTGNTADDIESKEALVVVNGNATVNMQYVSLNANYNMSAEGGAFVVNGDSPNITLTNCDVNKCYSKKSGSFMMLSTEVGGSVTLNSTNVHNTCTSGWHSSYDDSNTSNDNNSNGGILRTYGSNMATLEINGCKFYNNWTRNQATVTWASLGAAKSFSVGGKTQTVGCYINNSQVYDNTSYIGAAGISNSGSMIITSTTISGNFNVNGSGAGVSVGTWASATPYNDFELVRDGSMTLGSGVIIRNNKAPKGSGGGLSVSCDVIGTNTGNATLANRIYYYTKKDGTPYEMKIIVDGAEISGNTASSGGGISIIKSKRGSASDATLYDSNGKPKYKNNEFTNNSLYVVQFEMRSGNVINNTATGHTDSNSKVFYGHGGAVDLTDNNATGNTVDFIMSGGTISGNKATTNNSSRGGAVYVHGGGSFYMTGGTIESNTSYGFGGGAFVDTGNFNISSNATIKNNIAHYTGGGAHVLKGAFNMNGGTITNNTAYNRGGGAYLDQGDFLMTGGTISSNKALQSNGSVIDANDGGGVFVTGGGYLQIDDGNLTGNTAGSQGGAAYLENGDFVINNGTISSNRSYRSTGGVYVKNGNFTMNGGSITANKAMNENGEGYSTNTAGGVFVTGSNAVVTIKSGASITGNVSGGSGAGLFVDTGGTVRMLGGSITGNTAGASGGGIRIANGYFHMESGVITGNTAADSAGAIYLDGNSSGANGSVTILGGNISDNTAQNMVGGAIFVCGGTVNISGGTFRGNYAKTRGGFISVETQTVTYEDSSGNTQTRVNPCNVYIKGGEFSGNSTDGQGGAICVLDATNFEIGYEGCFGNGVKDLDGEWIHTPENAPIFTDNTALAGGGIYIRGGNPIIHCGKFYDNHAVAAGGSDGNGGGIFVANAGITVNYADILENDATNKGGGIYVNSSSADVSVLIDSGFVSYNTADVGAGIGVDVSGSYVATIVIGREGCTGDPESEHKHPQINYNIATTKGGGLYFVSTSASGIDFKMYCGRLGNNAANANVPTGNVLQQGGTISIAGDYAIDNATVLNGTYQRPTISTDTITIVYHYNNVDYTQGSSATSTVTVALGNDNRMFINLPTVDGKIGDKMLVRWELKDSEGSAVKESRVVGDRLILNQNNYAKNSTLNFYGVWLAVGDAYLEPAYVTTGKVFSTINSGLPYAYGKINNPFSVQFAVSRFNPYELGNRNLQFSEVAPAGTVIYMLYIKGTVTDFYYYNIVGDELRVDIDAFRRLGDPGAKWENTVNDISKTSSESFTFIFDFARCETGAPGTIQITLERNYDEAKVGEVRAPLTQIITYTMDDAYLPRLTPSVTETKPDTDVTITYDSGIASDNQSLYYGEETSLVIRDKDNVLDGEAYITLDGVKYYKNSEGIFIIPLGAANTSAEHTLSLHSASLPYRADRAVTLSASLYITSDGERPLASPCVDSFDITFVADALPSASISLAERVFYTDSLPEEGVQVLTTTANADGCTLTYSIAKLVGGVYSTTAAEEDGVSISSTGLISLTNATYGTFRITLTVSREGIPTSVIPYNFIVLDR